MKQLKVLREVIKLLGGEILHSGYLYLYDTTFTTFDSFKKKSLPTLFYCKGMDEEIAFNFNIGKHEM